MTCTGLNTVTVTTASKTLAQLIGSHHPNLKQIKLFTAGVITWSMGVAAGGSSAVLPPNIWTDLPIDQGSMNQIYFYGSNVAMTVVQFV